MAHLDDYEPVAARLERFWAEHPNGRVVPRLEHMGRHPDGSLMDCTFSAAIYRDQGDADPFATGTAYELRSDRGVNQLSAVENAETSAIGRALANGGYAAKGGPRPSREEMSKAARTAPQTTGGAPNPAAGPRAGGGAPSPGPAPSPAPPTMGEAIGNVLDAMPGTRIDSQAATPQADYSAGSPTPATDAQFRKATALAKSVGLVERGPDGAPTVNARGYTQIDWNGFGRFAADVLGHPVTTIKGMGKADMSAVIDALTVEEARQADPVNNPVTDDPWSGEDGGF
jgi:hypothetical protein